MVDVEDSPSKRHREKSTESPSKRFRIQSSIHRPQSTPQRKLCYNLEADDSILDDISSISSVIGGHSAVLTSRVLNQDISLSSTEQDREETAIFDREEIFEDYDDFFKDIGTTKMSKKFKDLFKPLRDNSIYNELFNNPKCAADVAMEIIDLFEQDRVECILKLFEFIVDVCGYQRVDVKALYIIDKKNWPQFILKHLESPECEEAEVYETRQYLLGAHKTKYQVIFRMAIFNFLQKLVLHANHRRILYDPFFNKHFFGALNILSKSHLRNIAHTVSVFGAKILSTLCAINKIICESEDPIGDGEIIERLMLLFFVCFFRSCDEELDEKCSTMLVDLTKEATVWLQAFPKLFIVNLDCLPNIMKLLRNASKTVRIEALKFCKYFVETAKFKEHFSTSMREQFSINIEERLLLDINEEVVMLAGETLAIFVKNQFGTVSEERIVDIARFISIPNCKVSNVCGTIWISFLSNAGHDKVQIVFEIIALSLKRQKRIPTIVKSLLPEFKHLTDWPFITVLLLSRELEVDRKIVLCKIAYETIHQVLFGISTTREDKEDAHPFNDKANFQIADHFLEPTRYFLGRYVNVANILIPLIKIVMLIKVENLPKNFAQGLNGVADAAREVFGITDNSELQDLLADFFLHLNDHWQKFLQDVKEFISEILVKHSKKFTEAISNPVLNKECGLELKRVAVLYSKFDMTNVLTWEQMKTDIQNLNHDICDSLMTCYYWHLFWQFRNLPRKYFLSQVDKKELQSLIDNTKKCCVSFLDQCTGLMKELNGQPLHYKVYDLVCKIHIDSANSLKDLCSYYKGFEILILNLEDRDELNLLLVDFVEKYVICNIRNLSLYERRCYVQHIINIAFLGTMPISFLASIFKYYESHKEEFGQQIEKCMTELQTHSASTTLPLVVVHTLRQVYLEILQKQKEVNIHSSDAKKLLALAKQFVNSKMALDNFLLFVINWTSQSDLYHRFLYFTRPFIDLASPQAKNEALSLIENKIEDLKHVSVVYFVNALTKAVTDSKKSETAKNKVTQSVKKVMAPPPLPITITPQKKQRKPKAKKPDESKLANLDVEVIEKKLHKAKL